MYHYQIEVFSLANRYKVYTLQTRTAKDVLQCNALSYCILISTFIEKHWCPLKVKAGPLCLSLSLTLPSSPSSLVVRQSVQSFPLSFITFSPLFLAWKVMRWAGTYIQAVKLSSPLFSRHLGSVTAATFTQ